MLGLSYFLLFISYATSRQIVRRHVHLHCVTQCDADKIQPHLTGDMRQQTMPICQLHPIYCVREDFNYPALNFNGILSRHVKISGSESVIKTVCSKWADNEPSLVTTVQPSFNTLTSGAPALI